MFGHSILIMQNWLGTFGQSKQWRVVLSRVNTPDVIPFANNYLQELSPFTPPLPPPPPPPVAWISLHTRFPRACPCCVWTLVNSSGSRLGTGKAGSWFHEVCWRAEWYAGPVHRERRDNNHTPSDCKQKENMPITLAAYLCSVIAQ